MKVAKRIWAVFLVLLASIFIPMLILVAAVSAFQQVFAEWRAIRSVLLHGNLACSIDSDCPPSYQCVGGRCAPI